MGKIIQRVVERYKFRWKYFCDPPQDLLYKNLGYRTIMEFGPADCEKVIWKRRLRAVLFGKGCGWTLRKAVLDFLTLGWYG